MGKLSGLFRGDRVIWIVFFALCIISIVEVFSALSTLTYKDGDFIRPILRHFAFLVSPSYFDGAMFVRTKNRKDLTMNFWRDSVPLFQDSHALGPAFLVRYAYLPFDGLGR